MKDTIKHCMIGFAIIATFMLCIWLIDQGLTITSYYLFDHDGARDIVIGALLIIITGLVTTWLSVLITHHRKELSEDEISRQD